MKLAHSVLWVAVSVLVGASVHGADRIAEAKRGIDEGRLQDAVRILSERLERRSRDVEALKLRALAHSGLGYYALAVRDYEAVLERKPKAASVHRDLGMLLAFKLKEKRHAFSHLDRFLTLDPDSELAAQVAGIMKSLDGRPSEKEMRVTRDLIKMAADLKSKGQAKLAEDVYRRALSIQPSCASCHELLGHLLLEEKRRPEGERHLAKARLFGQDG